MHNLENSETWNLLCIRKNVTYDNICIHAKTDKKKKTEKKMKTKNEKIQRK